jgi:hypothetical protein
MKDVAHLIMKSRYVHGTIAISKDEELLLFHIAQGRTSKQTEIKTGIKSHIIDNMIQDLYEKTGVPAVDNELRRRMLLVKWAEEHEVLFYENGEWHLGSERGGKWRVKG